ncbi:2Fe-2S iron-sulfur cluster-binding protein [Marinobacterium aestuariivivens]|uniref:2Fe-2S iron-sulfur cluster-binding protein n=1 Tax=Marinobacterium aestuariivivens TaxID=1698799 RepID=A0ABW2A8W4_9GAMM
MAQYLVWVANRGEQFECSDRLSVLAGMERAGNGSIHVGCRCGGCGFCRIRVVSGEYECKRMSRAEITERDEAMGFALACRIYARSDLVIESDHCRPEIATKADDCGK